jgi:hypothetical protein
MQMVFHEVDRIGKRPRNQNGYAFGSHFGYFLALLVARFLSRNFKFDRASPRDAIKRRSEKAMEIWQPIGDRTLHVSACVDYMHPAPIHVRLKFPVQDFLKTDESVFRLAVNVRLLLPLHRLSPLPENLVTESVAAQAEAGREVL